jgi:hypothetical protein
VNLSVFLGNYNLPNDAGVEYSNQKQNIVSAINTYGTDHILGITVGNEFMLEFVHPCPSLECLGRGIYTYLNLAISLRLAQVTRTVQLALRALRC